MSNVPGHQGLFAVESIRWASAGTSALVGCVWISLIIYCIVTGLPQKREANGTLSRLLWVSCLLSTLGALPAAIVASFAIREQVAGEQWLVAAISTLYSLTAMRSVLLPPVRFEGGSQNLPIITDERFLFRVKSLATRMKISTPMVRRWASQEVMGYVGTPHAPQLVVTDGAIHRLESEECDFIIAHELAHIANGSLIASFAIIPFGCAVTTAVAFLLPYAVAVLFGIAFTGGLLRLVRRPAEFDCDSRAVKVTSVAAGTSALRKIHASHLFPDSGMKWTPFFGPPA